MAIISNFPFLNTTSWNDITDKPFYEEGGMVEVLAECQPPFDDSYGQFVLYNQCQLEIGKNYIVDWNGTEYTGTVIDGSPEGFGDNSAVLVNDGADKETGEGTVFIITYTKFSTGDDEIHIIDPSGSDSLTIAIYQDNTIIHPIEGKYLPKGTPWIEEGEMVEILPEYTINSEEDMAGIPALGLAAGNTYTVTLNGTEYTCAALNYTHPTLGACVVLGDIYTATGGEAGIAATGEPFVLVEVSPEVAAQAGVNVLVAPLVEMSFPVVFSIFGGGATIHKLDNRCLDLAWLPVVKDGWKEIVPETTFDGLSQDNLNMAMLDGVDKVKVTTDGTEYECSIYRAGETTWLIGNKSLLNADTYADTGEPFLITVLDIMTSYAPTSIKSNTVSIAALEQVPNKLPDEFLPDDAMTASIYDPAGKAQDVFAYADAISESANQYTDEKIAAIPTPDVSGQINSHNTDTSAHTDIREAISDVSDVANTAKSTAEAAQSAAETAQHTADGKADENHSHAAAGASLGFVKSGGDVTISDGIITVNDDSHNHTIANVDGLQTALNSKETSGAAATALSDAKSYTDTKVSGITIPVKSVNGKTGAVVLSAGDVGAPTTSALTTHTDNTTVHITASERTAWNAKLDQTLKGAASGLAELDANGKVPSSQLPSYVDDVVEASAKSSFPSTGEAGKIYVDTSTNKTYRWSGSAYVEISASLALGETSSTAYRGDRGKTAYDHSQVKSGNPHGVTKSDVGLGSVENKSSATIRGEITSANVTTALGFTPADSEDLTAHTGNTSNPHNVTTTQIGAVPTSRTINGKALTGNITLSASDVGAAASSHGTHVTYSTTAPVADGTASAGSATTVARSDHKHPTDTTRAAASDLTSHTGNTTVHITAAERTAWNAKASTSAATTSAAGLMSASDKTKLNGVETGAEVNQNAFSNVVVGSTTIAADAKTDTLTLVAGNNVTLTPDATNDKITIAATDTTYSAATTSAAGLMSASDKSKLDGVAAGANAYSHPTTSGNKHIPSGGSSGQILRWSADGTAAWGADNNTTYSVVSTTADGLAPKRDGSITKFLRADGTWAVPPDTDTKYTHPAYTAKSSGLYKVTVDATGHVSATGAVTKSDITGLGIPAQDTVYTLPNATASVLGGVKIGSNISVSNGVISVPAASDTQAGVTIVYPAASCTTFSSDTGTVTPLAVQKGAKQFAITRPTSSTNKAIVRYSNTTGDVQNSKILIEDVTNTRDTSKTANVLSIPAEGGKKMVYGYCTDQVDGTSFIGGVFDASATEFPYAAGLAIGGTSGNLLWKGQRVLDNADLTAINNSLSAKAPLASPTFTGTPKAPTAAAGTNTTQIATTAFVQSAVSAKPSAIFAAGTSAPSDTRLLWIDTTANTGGLKYYNGSAWVVVPVAYS